MSTGIFWTKLRNGEWGIKGVDLAAGELVNVTKKNGQTQTVRVGKVLWSNDEIQIATVAKNTTTATAKAPRFTSSTRSNRAFECDECGEWVRHGSVCWETGLQH